MKEPRPLQGLGCKPGRGTDAPHGAFSPRRPGQAPATGGGCAAGIARNGTTLVTYTRFLSEQTVREPGRVRARELPAPSVRSRSAPSTAPLARPRCGHRGGAARLRRGTVTSSPRVSAAAGKRRSGGRGAAAAGAMPGQKSFRRRREDDDEEEEDEQLAEEVRWVGRRRGTRPGPAGNAAAVEGRDGTAGVLSPAVQGAGGATPCRDIVRGSGDVTLPCCDVTSHSASQRCMVPETTDSV